MRHTVVDDVGRMVNPMLVKGQIHGGIVQGLGQGLFEDLVYDRDTGQLLSGSFMDYAMPRADDMPFFDVDSHEVPTQVNPLGAKGVGEAGTVGALPALLNAVNDALAPLGVRHLDMPLTPGARVARDPGRAGPLIRAETNRAKGGRPWPRRPASSHVYVGGARSKPGTLGGVFRRAVGDDRWEQLGKGLARRGQCPRDHRAPRQPGHRLSRARTQGPFRSTDRGERWERPAFDEGVEIWSILVHPHNPRRLYAGASPVGVYRSDDGGDTWRRMPGVAQPERVRMEFPCRVMRLSRGSRERRASLRGARGRRRHAEPGRRRALG